MTPALAKKIIVKKNEFPVDYNFSEICQFFLSSKQTNMVQSNWKSGCYRNATDRVKHFHIH